MRRTRAIDAAFLLAIAVAGAVFWMVSRNTVRRGSDAEVIETALLSLYEKTNWNQYWTSGDYILVRPSHTWSEREDFDLAFGRLISNVTDRKEQANLFEIRQASSKYVDPPAPAKPLISMKLDERIVASAIPSNSSTVPQQVANASGKLGSVRLSARLGPPCYSPERKYAIVEALVQHEGRPVKLAFLLHRQVAGWTVAHASVTHPR